MKKKNLKSFNDFKNLDKKTLIDELMKKTIKGGCCKGEPDTGMYLTTVIKWDHDSIILDE